MIEEIRRRFEAVAREAVDFALFAVGALDDVLLGNPTDVDLITSDAFTHRTYYMGLVDDHNHAVFYDG